MPLVSKFSPWLNDRVNADLAFLRSHAATPALSPEERAYLKGVNATLRAIFEGVPSQEPQAPDPARRHARLPQHHRAYVILNPEGLTLRKMAAKLGRPVQTLAQIRSDHRMRVLGFPAHARPRRRTGPAEHMEPFPEGADTGPRVYPTRAAARDRWIAIYDRLEQPKGTLPLPEHFEF